MKEGKTACIIVLGGLDELLARRSGKLFLTGVRSKSCAFKGNGNQLSNHTFSQYTGTDNVPYKTPFTCQSCSTTLSRAAPSLSILTLTKNCLNRTYKMASQAYNLTFTAIPLTKVSVCFPDTDSGKAAHMLLMRLSKYDHES